MGLIFKNISLRLIKLVGEYIILGGLGMGFENVYVNELYKSFDNLNND